MMYSLLQVWWNKSSYLAAGEITIPLLFFPAPNAAISFLLSLQFPMNHPLEYIPTTIKLYNTMSLSIYWLCKEREIVPLLEGVDHAAT
jgi:hypothetical protein